MKSFSANERGIALMLVLGAIVILSMIVLEFVFDTTINYRLAVNEKDRLRAYYLAESAINLMKLELKFDKAYRSMLAGSQASQYVSSNLGGPLCQQFPISTALLRGIFLEPSKGESEEGAESEEAARIEAVRGVMVTSFGSEAAEEFLGFEGDFSGECSDEQSKFNLNVFAGLDPSQQVLSGLNAYDSFKQILKQFLSNESFEGLFESDRRADEINEIVRNIADWEDKDDVMNEEGGATWGSEDSVYQGRKDETKVKNAKFLSLDELYLVEGVKDDWFSTLKDKFTVYGDNKINVCLAEDDVVEALILQYISTNPNIAPISPTNKEKLKQLVDVVKNACIGASPHPQQIAQALNQALGVGGTFLGGSPPPSPTTGTRATPPATATGFASMITTNSRFYRLKGTGEVGNAVVNIVTVLDAQSIYPKNWKTLYWRVE